MGKPKNGGPAIVAFSTRIPQDLNRRLEDEAARDKRTKNAELEVLLTEALDQRAAARSTTKAA